MKTYIKKFRIKCSKDKDSKYYNVFVFADFENMYKYARKHNASEDKDYYGLCHEYERFLKNTETGELTLCNDIGVILLHKSHLDVETLSHECCHAAAFYLDRYTKKVNCMSVLEVYDEIFAETQSFLITHLVKKLYKFNLIA